MKRPTPRGVILAVAFLMVAAGASRISWQSGSDALTPVDHPFMKAASRAQIDMRDADSILVALTHRSGTVFNGTFLDRLRTLVDDVASLPGADRSAVQSLFSPSAKVFRLVNDGLTAEDIVPIDFRGTPEQIETIRTNLEDSGQIGRLVTRDLKTALISVPMNPASRSPAFARGLSAIRERYDRGEFSLRVVGGPVVRAQIASGVRRGLLLQIAGLLAAVVFLGRNRGGRGIIRTFGMALGPVVGTLGALGWMRIPVHPFALSFVLLTGLLGAVLGPRDQHRAPVSPLVPMAAFFSAGILFLIDIAAIRSIAVVLLIGGAALAGTLRFYADHTKADRLSFSRPTNFQWMGFAGTAVLLTTGLLLARAGHPSSGWPDLTWNSRHNRDIRALTASVGPVFNALVVYARTVPDGCVDPEVMRTIDVVSGELSETPGVGRVISLAEISKRSSALWYEGQPKWRVVPKNASVLSQAVSAVPPSSGFLNFDCSVMPIMLYLNHHRPSLLNAVASPVRRISSARGAERVSFEPGGGSAGILIALQEEAERVGRPVILGSLSITMFLLILLRQRTPLVFCAGLAGAAGATLLGSELLGVGLLPMELACLVAATSTAGTITVSGGGGARHDATRTLAALSIGLAPLLASSAAHQAHLGGLTLGFAILSAGVAALIEPARREASEGP